MAGGWTRDGAVQDQIDDTVKDAVLRARALTPQGESAEVLVSKPVSDGACHLGQSEGPLSVDVKLLAGGGNQAIDDRRLQQLRAPVETTRPAGLIPQRDQDFDRFFQYRAQSQTS